MEHQSLQQKMSALNMELSTAVQEILNRFKDENGFLPDEISIELEKKKDASGNQGTVFTGMRLAITF
jgi:hypothetical protein